MCPNLMLHVNELFIHQCFIKVFDEILIYPKLFDIYDDFMDFLKENNNNYNDNYFNYKNIFVQTEIIDERLNLDMETFMKQLKKETVY
jgi:hypothetical protein